jgi:hypothetical protein
MIAVMVYLNVNHLGKKLAIKLINIAKRSLLVAPMLSQKI